MENWKDIPGYVRFYQVSDLGRVRSLTRTLMLLRNGKEEFRTYKGRVLKQGCYGGKKKPHSYRFVILAKPYQSQVNKSVSRLVAIAFVPRIKGLNFVNHVNGYKPCNRATNLEWATRSRNMKHAYEKGLAYPRP